MSPVPLAVPVRLAAVLAARVRLAAVLVATACAVAAAPAAARGAGYPDAVRADGARPYFRLDDPQGTTARDASGADRDGTFTGTVTAGRPGALPGNAATGFDGATGMLVTADKIAGPDAFSLELWFRTRGEGGGWLAGFTDSRTGAGSSRDRLLYVDGAGRLVFGITRARR